MRASDPASSHIARATALRRVLFMLGLVIAGEAVFALPLHIPRFFRPTVLDVFGLSNTELGAAQAVYGVVAMIAYFPGGALADRFSARKLLAVSLVATALGGLHMATFPGPWGLGLLFGYWGCTTILLFWAALIRATREWGGASEQGEAYGILDGGRGVLAAGLASLAVALLGLLLPEDSSAATPEQRADGLRAIIYCYSAVTLGAAALVWWFVPEASMVPAGDAARHHWVARFRLVLRLPSIWLQALVVICAYVGYKGFDNYSLYATQGFGMNEVDAAGLVTLGAWVRPFAAVGAGFLGDRVRSSRVIIVLFCLLLASDLYLALAPPTPSAIWVFLVNILLASIAVFGFRGLYFALFQEAKVPLAVTGTAVGVVSVIGYTPDVFVNVTGGLILDSSPGIVGHQRFFLFLAAFAALGMLAALAFERLNRDRSPVAER
jgi:nitrate/nitrite transporter NarK